MTEKKKVSFNINAELYQDRDGDLAVKLAGEKAFRNAGERAGASFAEDVQAALEGMIPADWQEMPAHELLYGHDWNCLARLGFLGGDTEKPGVEFHEKQENLGEKARAYLREALH